MNELLIFGNGEIAKLASEFVKNYTKYKIHGFIVDDLGDQVDKYFNNKKIIQTKNLKDYSPKKYLVFVALSYRKLNRLREEKYK